MCWRCILTFILYIYFFVFQPLEYKPVPLDMNEEQRYLLALKEEYKGAMRESPYYILPANKITDIQRYSDKYQLAGSDNSDNWEPGKIDRT